MNYLLTDTPIEKHKTDAIKYGIATICVVSVAAILFEIEYGIFPLLNVVRLGIDPILFWLFIRFASEERKHTWVTHRVGSKLLYIYFFLWIFLGLGDSLIYLYQSVSI